MFYQSWGAIGGSKYLKKKLDFEDKNRLYSHIVGKILMHGYIIHTAF